MTKQTKQFIWAMRGLTLVYFLGAFMNFFRPEETFYLINVGPKVFKTFEEVPMPSERFWIVLSSSFMVTLALLSFYSSLYPNIKGFVVTHLAAKLTSIAGFTWLFLNQIQYFAYLIAAIIETCFALIILFVFIRKLAIRNTPMLTQDQVV